MPSEPAVADTQDTSKKAPAQPEPSTEKAKQGEPKKEKKPKKEKAKKDKAKKDKKDKKGKKKKLTAATADKYVLYQKSVQAPDADVEFILETYESIHGKKPTTLREDFCGAAAMACEWIRTAPENKAWGVDIDPEPLSWGKEHNVSKLNEEQLKRLTLIQGDVREAREPKVDVVAAQNFSFCCFKTRKELLNYFKVARQGLKPGGIMVLDIFGGPESQAPAEDQTKHKGFKYVWDQKAYDAITNEIKCAIHFKFKDGTWIRDAFEYDWRLWTIAELREILVEAGFSKANAYWEGTDEDDEGNGEFTLQENAENEDAWIAYVVGIN